MKCDVKVVFCSCLCFLKTVFPLLCGQPLHRVVSATVFGCDLVREVKLKMIALMQGSQCKPKMSYKKHESFVQCKLLLGYHTNMAWPHSGRTTVLILYSLCLYFILRQINFVAVHDMYFVCEISWLWEIYQRVCRANGLFV